MADVNYGDLVDLQIRLDTLASGDRELVPVFGSGLSNAELPDIKTLTGLFREAVPAAGRRRFDDMIDPIMGTPLAYQNAASMLRNQAGDRAVARVIRKAVLGACLESGAPGDLDELAKDLTECRRLEREAKWRVPQGYRQFARYYAGLPGSLRSKPIITTNFDPFIEIALREAGVAAEAIPVGMDNGPTVDQLAEKIATPVLHIHGYWLNDGTLNTVTQLTKPRPALHHLLARTFTGSVVLVVGYSGWEDAFMQSLAKRVREADLLNAEILWAAYPEKIESVLTNETLANLDGLPGFAVYLGVDGHALFDRTDPLPDPKPGETFSPFGYTRLPVTASTGPTNRASFVDGAQPQWADAESGVWPVLMSARKVMNRTREAMAKHGGGRGVVAIGPVGEGKSLGIRQAATTLSREMPEWTALWREPGAPAISTDWLAEARAAYGKILICVDDADLVAADLAAAADLWAVPDSGIVFLLASNDRLWWSRPGALALRRHVQDVLFDGVTDEEAVDICAAWDRVGLVPNPAGVSAEQAVNTLAQSLVASLHSMPYGQNSTLFGAILDTRFGDGLKDRVGDLVAKLSAIKVQPDSAVSVGDIFGGICVLQHSTDPRGTLGHGASRSLIAAMVDRDGVYADGKILDALGREAAIMFAGNHIYSRHPAIAKAVVHHLREQGRMTEICKRVARAGARLFSIGNVPSDDYRHAYLLTQKLEAKEESLAAGVGAVEGATELLEPRVTLLSQYRKHDPVHAEKVAVAYGARLTGYRDHGTAVRAFLNEYAQVVGKNHQPQLALGLAALSLHDGVGFRLDEKRAGYSLLTVLKFALQLRQQNPAIVGDIPELACRAAASVLKPAEEKHLDPFRVQIDMSSVAALSPAAVSRRLGPLLSEHAKSAVEKTGISVEFVNAIEIRDLERLIR